MLNYSRYLNLAQEAAALVAAYLRDNFGPVKPMTHKEGTHFGIADDVHCNNLYEQFFHRETPGVAIYSEEGEQNLDSELVWVIDPIDGTSNYRVGIPLFVTQLCLLHQGEPVVSVINAPMLNEVYTAQKNKGARCNGQAIEVSTIQTLNHAMVALNKGHSVHSAGELMTRLGPKARTARILGSMGIDLAYTSCGKVDLLINTGAQLHDFAPGVLMVREAGGVALNFAGDKWAIRDQTLIAGNQQLVGQALAVLQV